MEEKLHHLNAELTKQVQAYEAVVKELKTSKDTLEEKNEALERFHDVVVDRELKMIELEKEVQKLKQRLAKEG
ncbi:MAG: hypothetical protein ACREJU_14015, partial [Nitrospiraceae bacterium]